MKEALRIDADVKNLIERAGNYINQVMGIVIDFETDYRFDNLLINRCRYDYNNASEYFEKNFSDELLRLQLIVGVEARE